MCFTRRCSSSRTTLFLSYTPCNIPVVLNATSDLKISRRYLPGLDFKFPSPLKILQDIRFVTENFYHPTVVGRHPDCAESAVVWSLDPVPIDRH